MSKSAFKAYLKAPKDKRQKGSKTTSSTGIPLNDHTERERVIERLREGKP